LIFIKKKKGKRKKEKEKRIVGRINPGSQERILV
jgi:hypothetical protein